MLKKRPQNGLDLPLINTSIKYKSPLFLGEKITIESEVNIDKSPRINVISKFQNKKNEILTIAEVNLVLINKLNFSIIRKRPDFLSEAFSKLNGCLLYTSPSPRDWMVSRMPSSA